jgi:nitrogen-specific signal transduction histidine kinase
VSGRFDRVTIDLAIPTSLPPVHTDPHQLEMAILNLAVNARDAMSNDGILTLKASEVSIPQGMRDDRKRRRNSALCGVVMA